jgi:hypothetical protein
MAKKVSGVGTKTRRSRRRKAVISDADCDPDMDQGLQQDTEEQDGGDDGNGASFETIGQSTRSVDDLEKEVNSMKGESSPQMCNAQDSPYMRSDSCSGKRANHQCTTAKAHRGNGSDWEPGWLRGAGRWQ